MFLDDSDDLVGLHGRLRRCSMSVPHVSYDDKLIDWSLTALSARKGYRPMPLVVTLVTV